MQNSEPTSSLRDPANLLIASLILLIAILGSARMNARHKQRSGPATRITIQGRMGELQQGLLKTFGTSQKIKWSGPQLDQPWDRALMAVMGAEAGNLNEAQKLAMEGPLPAGAGSEFRRCWAAAYLGEGAIPNREEQRQVSLALREGYGAQLLGAKLSERSGKDSSKLRNQAEAWFEQRAAILILVGLVILVGIPGGLVFAVALGITWPRRADPAPSPASRIPTRRMLITLLGWFFALLISGDVAAQCIHLLPFLAPFMLPLIYGFHASVGVGLLCWAQQTSLRNLFAPLFPGTSLRQIAWALGFLLLGVMAVMLTGLALSPFLNGKEPPQKELMDLVSGTSSTWTIAFMLLTAAVIAPIFEELLFRGTLMPWLAARAQSRLGSRWAWILALAGSALVFGLIHMEPMALPSLTVLGAVLALTFLRTRNLLPSIIVHGIWNGSILLFYRILMG